MSDPLGLFGNQDDPLGLDPLGLFKQTSPSALDSFVSGAKGTAAAIGDVAGGLIKLPVQAALAVGGKIADPSNNLQSTWESAGKAVEDTFPSFGAGMEDNLGYTAPMKPFELYGKGANYVAEKASMGNKDVEGALNIGANFLPIPFAGKAGRLAGKVIEKVDPGLRNIKAKPTGPDLAGIAAETSPTPVTPKEAPLVDTKSSYLKSLEAYQAALRERKLAQESAFNPVGDVGRERPVGDMTQQEMFGPAFELAREGESAPRELLRMPTEQMDMFGSAMDLEHSGEIAPKKPYQQYTKQSDMFGPDLTLTSEGKMGPGLSLREQEAARLAADVEKHQRMQQALIDDTQHVLPDTNQVIAPQYGAMQGVGRFDEHGMPIRADLSMEAQHLTDPNQMGLWGDELAPKHELELTKMPPLGSLARAALRKRQGGMVNPKVFQEGFQKVKTLANGVVLKARGLGDQLNIEATLDGKHVGGVVFNKTNPYGSPMHSDAMAPMVGSKLKGTATEMYRFSSELGNDIVPSGKQTEAGKGMWEGFAAKGLAKDGYIAKRTIQSPGNKQGGKVLFDFGKKKERDTLATIPGIKDRIGDIAPDQRPIEQFLKEEAGGKDVEQNWAQRASNYFTKGSLYQAIKTGNPIVKRVSDAVIQASRTTKGEIASYVHERLAPAAQRLSDSEKADVWAAQVIAESNKAELSRETLLKHGFNENQISWVETHAEVMRDMLKKMNAVMKATGQQPVSPRVAYLASRASGDYRRLIYKEVNREKTPVSILGANTRGRLTADVEKLKAAHPEWIIGEEKYYGGSSARGSATEGFTALLDLLSKDSPEVKLLADHVNEILTKDSFNYMNAKTHTMAKKGITGMEGRKELSTAIENARDGMQAQINYAERMIEWANLAEAVEQLKPILHKDNGLDMPNAKSWSEDYVQHALGNNPGAVGRNLDKAFAAAFEKAGVGPSIVHQIPARSKSFVNGILLGFGNIGFMGMNLVQPLTSSPAMAAFLKGRGLEKSFDAGTGYKYLADGVTTAWKETNGEKLSPVEEGAFKYAKKNHVYSSDLFDSSNKATKDLGHYWDKGIQIGSGAIEMRTRQVAFLSYVKLLHENGMSEKSGLYETAHNLTDMQMNNYHPTEMPKVYTEVLGKTMGSLPANLMSYKHNELSRLAMMVNEIGRSGTAAPLLTHIASSIAFAGVLGTIGYAEADAFTKMISKMMGKPTSLTKILLDNPDIPEQLKYGIGSTAGVDLTSRLGTGALVPGHVVDAIMPGAGKLVSIAGAGIDAVKDPSEFNVKNLARELAPNSVGGALDRAWFSKKNANGEEMSISRTTGKPIGDVRNEADKAWKTIGMTGMHEAKEKSKLWENAQINKWYADKQKAVILSATKQFAMDSTIPPDFAMRFVKAQGDPATLEATLNKLIQDGSMDQKTAQLMYNASANSIASTHKLLRMIGEE